MKNVHLIATDKPSKLFINELLDNMLVFCITHIASSNNQNIYITSNEEININDYITDDYIVWKWKDDSSLLGRKKIILTSDPDLILDGVQTIDDEFLEWFVKNPNCEEVEIDLLKRGIYDDYKFRIIIPKEESKQRKMFLMNSTTLIDTRNPTTMANSGNRKVGTPTTEGWQYCEYCKMDTMHTPKLGLVALGKRLCTMCNHSNYLKTKVKVL